MSLFFAALIGLTGMPGAVLEAELVKQTVAYEQRGETLRLVKDIAVIHFCPNADRCPPLLYIFPSISINSEIERVYEFVGRSNTCHLSSIFPRSCEQITILRFNITDVFKHSIFSWRRAVVFNLYSYTCSNLCFSVRAIRRNIVSYRVEVEIRPKLVLSSFSHDLVRLFHRPCGFASILDCHQSGIQRPLHEVETNNSRNQLEAREQRNPERPRRRSLLSGEIALFAFIGVLGIGIGCEGFKRRRNAPPIALELAWALPLACGAGFPITALVAI